MVVVQFDARAVGEGVASGHCTDQEFCDLLREQMGRSPDYKVGRSDDACREGGSGRKRDLEVTFLTLRLKADDGQFDDADVREQFRLALLRASQGWEQEEARQQA